MDQRKLYPKENEKNPAAKGIILRACQAEINFETSIEETKKGTEWEVDKGPRPL